MNNNVRSADIYPYRETRKAFALTAIGLLVLRFVQRACMYSFAAFFGNLFPGFADTEYFVWFVSYFPFYFIAVPIFCLLTSFLPKWEMTEKRSIGFSGWIKLFAACYALMEAGQIVSNLINNFFSAFKGSEVTNPVNDIMSRSGFLVTFIVVGIAAPVFEEIVFRKTMIDHLRLYGERTAVVYSAVLFGAFHGNFSQCFYAFTIGLLFGYVYLRTGKLRYSVSFHIGINSISVFTSEILKRAETDILDEIADDAGLTEYLSSHGVWLLLILLIAGLTVAAAVFGLIFLIRHRRNVYFNKALLEIPKGKKAVTVWLNVGTVLFIVYELFECLESALG